MRDYKRLDQDKFRSDIESAPSHIGSIFMERQRCLMSNSLIICGTFHIICSAFLICGAFHIICSTFFIICGAFHIICSAFLIICGAFYILCIVFIICGAFFIMRMRSTFYGDLGTKTPQCNEHRC